MYKNIAIIIIILWVLFCIFGAYKTFAQTQQQSNQSVRADTTYVVHRDYWDKEYKWDCINCDQWGSFYWKITRTRQKWTDGYYYYFVYFYSNSLFDELDEDGNYEKAISYITDIEITMINKDKESDVHEMKYDLIDWEVTRALMLYSIYHDNLFKLNFGSVDPFDYSEY